MTLLLLLSWCFLTVAMSQKMSHILMNMVAQDPYTRNMMRLPLFQELFDIEIPPTTEPSSKQLGAASLFGLAGNGIFGGPSQGSNTPRASQTGSQTQTSELMSGTPSWDRSSFGSGQSAGRVSEQSQFDGMSQMTGSGTDTSQNGPPQLRGSLTWPQQNNGRSFGNSPTGNGFNWPPTIPSNTQMGGALQTAWPQQQSGNQPMGDSSSWPQQMAWPPQMGGVITWPSFGGNLPGNQQIGNNIPGNSQPQWPVQIDSNRQMGNPSNQGNFQPQWPAQMGSNQQMRTPPNPGNSQPQLPAQMGNNQQMSSPPNQGNFQPQWPAQMGGSQPIGATEYNNPSWNGVARPPNFGDSNQGNSQMGGSMPGNTHMGGPMPRNTQMGGPILGNTQMGGSMPGNTQMGGPIPGNTQMGGPMPGNNQMGGPMPGNNQIGDSIPGNTQMGGLMPGNFQSSPPYEIASNTRPKIPLDFIVQLYNTASNPIQGEPSSSNTIMEGQGSQADPSTMASFSNTPRQPRAIIQAGQVILPKGPPSRNFIDRLMALGGAEGIEIV